MGLAPTRPSQAKAPGLPSTRCVKVPLQSCHYRYQMPMNLKIRPRRHAINPITPALGAWILLAGLAAAPSAWAEEPISTDRPDFVESSLVVGPGRMQIETSVAYQRDTQGGEVARVLAVPTLLRIGLGESWEARAETDGWLSQRVEDGSGQQTDTTGFSDVALGVKYHLPGTGPFDASSALLLHVDLATGAKPFRGDGARPSLRYVAEWEIADQCSLGVMPGLAYQTDGAGQRYLSGIAGITVAYAWTERFRSFVELAAEEWAAGDHADTQLSLDTGVAYLVSNDLQLDAALYSGLNRHTPDTTGTLGVSFRW